MTSSIKDKLNGGTVAPWKILSLQNIITLSAVLAVLVGMLYLFEGQNNERVADQGAEFKRDVAENHTRSLILNNTADIKSNMTQAMGILYEDQQRGNAFRNQSAATEAAQLKAIEDSISEIVQNVRRDVNLTTAEQRSMIDQIRNASAAIPKVYEELAERGQRVQTLIDQYNNLSTTLTEHQENLDELIELLKDNPYIY